MTASMTRQHFQALADVYAEALEDETRPDVRAAITRLIEETADVCARFNGNFDRGRFLFAATSRPKSRAGR